MGIRNVHGNPPGGVGGSVSCQCGHKKDQESHPNPIFDNISSYLASPFVYLSDEIGEEQ